MRKGTREKLQAEEMQVALPLKGRWQVQIQNLGSGLWSPDMHGWKIQHEESRTRCSSKVAEPSQLIERPHLHFESNEMGLQAEMVSSGESISVQSQLGNLTDELLPRCWDYLVRSH